jgi:hypothetical protein
MSQSLNQNTPQEIQHVLTSISSKFSGKYEIKIGAKGERDEGKKKESKEVKVKLSVLQAVEAHMVETSRLPHFLDNRLTDGGEVVSLMRRPAFTPQEDSWYSFLLEAGSTPQGHSAAGRIRSIKKSNDLIGNRTRDLPACSIVPQPTKLPLAPDRKE